MKKKIAFFFFLLIFIRCSDDGTRPLSLITAIEPVKSAHDSHPAKNTQAPSAVKAQFQVSGTHTAAPRTKRRKRQPKHDHVDTGNLPSRERDSLFISRLNYLRANHIEIDLNEPVSKNFLFNPDVNQVMPPFITLGNESYLALDFDNDILDYTDRFYTNGIKIDLVTPGLQGNPLCRLMVPYRRGGRNYYGITLVQNMYTPSTTKIGGILYGDRPYSAYLFFGTFKISLDPVRHVKQTSELDFGIIGPNSYGEWVQRSFHKSVPTNSEPLGWEYQVRNDLVLNYSLKMEKGIWNSKNADAILSASAEAGTLYTNLGGGFLFRTGWLNPYFSNIGVARVEALRKPGLRKFQFIFFVSGSGKLVGYDATLEGGVFNRSSPYTLPFSEISRFVLQGSGGISITYSGFRIDMEQFLLSPEFHNGWWHKWVHMSLTFCL